MRETTAYRGIQKKKITENNICAYQLQFITNLLINPHSNGNRIEQHNTMIATQIE